MRQESYENNITSMSDDVKSTEFTLEGNNFVFQMLTQNVYNDPILAVMREWSTNACDACIGANLPVNYDVHIPTTSEPTFYVRDYGTGLSIEDIEGLYSTLGASTKRDCNKQNGTFGIGRMAGLAGNEAFTVESYHNGKLHMYTISKNNGKPVTLYLGSEDTEEPNGLKLTVPVDYKQISTYRARASDLYKYFDYKPNLNVDDIDITLNDNEHISEDWYIIPKEDRSVYSSNNYVLMSQVLYQIPINSTVYTKDFTNLVIRAEPDTITINPGRESLSLDSKTVEYLNQRFKDIFEEYVAIAQSTFAASKNDYELLKQFQLMVDGAPKKILERLKVINFYSKELLALSNVNSSHYTSSHWLPDINISSPFYSLTNNQLSISHKNSYYKTSRLIEGYNSVNCSTFFNTPHVIVDLKTKFRAALNDHFNKMAVITWQRKDRSVEVEDAVKEAKKLLDTLGIPYKLASDLIGKEEIIVKPKIERTGLFASPIHRSGEFHTGTKMEKDKYEKGEFLYVKLKNTTPILKDNSFSFYVYMQVYNIINNIEKLPPILGVAKKYQPLADDLNNFLDFEEYIKNKCSTLTLHTGPEIHPYPIDHKFKHRDLSVLPEDMQKYFEENYRYSKFITQKTYINMDSNKNILKTFGATFEEYEKSADLDIEELNKVYKQAMPLLTEYRYGKEDSFTSFAYLAKLEKFYDIHKT